MTDENVCSECGASRHRVQRDGSTGRVECCRCLTRRDGDPKRLVLSSSDVRLTAERLRCPQCRAGGVEVYRSGRNFVVFCLQCEEANRVSPFKQTFK